MDTTAQVYEADATGWQRGLYQDIRTTFRAPLVNWIFRTTMANEPEFLRYAWGQVKPVFETEAFAEFTVAYRDTVLSEVESGHELPGYGPADVGLTPAEFRELQGQVATFDIVAPRLAILFELVDRGLNGGGVGTNSDKQEAACAPFPDALDRDRGLAPTMLPQGYVPDDAQSAIDGLTEFHGFSGGLPSIYRCLGQWPSYLDTVWRDLEPVFESAEFEAAVSSSERLKTEFVERVAYQPQLSASVLSDVGFSNATIEDVQDLFASFNTGPVRTVIPALPLYATTVNADGKRDRP
ncbi:halocarboxylic acid dehydrogenase DehI family protein [Haladaptatus sp. YSMS36]|uniref:halocarboxylic acid dehydrogenase DehI family protein n=1 Tax=Haladaptatus sp. YSMS36 TaxID=3033384 RepID=UPI0023E80487|nr:halocarboxylic acid dehydrogenase DehI family protein [Haladaptatus sp. YSMS36]